MSIDTRVVKNAQTVEYGKFVELVNDSRFPAVSVTRVEYRDTSNAFPNNQGLPPLTSVEIYPKFAVLTYDTSTGTPNSTPFGDNASTDAFGRLRVSSPNTLLDAKQIYGKSEYLFDELRNGTGNTSQTAGDSCVVMNTVSNNDYVIRQTKQRFNYQPGKSIIALMTGTLSTESEIVKRIGLFSGSFSAPYAPQDGIYFENNSGIISINIIKNQGTTNTETVAQSQWNVDKLDGSGPSGIVLDLSKTNIFVIDYEWLGVGRVRAGFVIDGKYYYVHYFNHANALSNVYMTSPNHPVRYEIRQTGVNPIGGSMKHICSTVITEGGEDDVGTPFSIDRGATTNNYDSTLRPLLGIRQNKNYAYLVNKIKNIDILNTNNAAGAMFVYLNPTITGTLNYSNSARGIEYAVGDSSMTMSGGTLLFSTFVPKDGGTSHLDLGDKFSSLGISISGKSDEYVIGVKAYAGNGTYTGFINLLERG